jgi:hypothetical protein
LESEYPGIGRAVQLRAEGFNGKRKIGMHRCRSWAVATPKSSNIFRVGHGAATIKALLSADSDFGKLTQSAIDQRGEDEGPGVEEI